MSKSEEFILLRTLQPVHTGQEFNQIPPHDLVLFSSLALISRQDAASNSNKRVEYAVQLPTAGVWGDTAAWAVRS